MPGPHNYPVWPGHAPLASPSRDRRRTLGDAVAPLPIVATVGANGITTTTANLVGSMDPNATSGLSQSWFAYGTTQQITSVTPTVAVALGTTPVTLVAPLSGLTQGTTYYFACVGQTAAGTVIGPVLSFVPSIPSPIVLPPNPPGAIVPFGQAQVTIPHFDMPFTLTNDGADVADQSTLEEVRANVLAIAICPVGGCPELPGFGIPQPTFAQAPLPTAEIIQAIQHLEPRAQETAIVSPGADGSSWYVSIETAAVGAQLS